MKISSKHWKMKDKSVFDITFKDGNFQYEDCYTKEELIDFAFELLDIANYEGRLDDQFKEIFMKKFSKEFEYLYEEIKETEIEKYNEDYQ